MGIVTARINALSVSFCRPLTLPSLTLLCAFLFFPLRTCCPPSYPNQNWKVVFGPSQSIQYVGATILCPAFLPTDLGKPSIAWQYLSPWCLAEPPLVCRFAFSETFQVWNVENATIILAFETLPLILTALRINWKPLRKHCELSRPLFLYALPSLLIPALLTLSKKCRIFLLSSILCHSPP